MNAPDLYNEIANRCPGIPMSDIREAVSAIPAAFGTPSSAEVTNPTTMMVVGELAEDTSAGATYPPGVAEFNYPESFRCYVDENGDYQVESPYVCLPNGTYIAATGGNGISGQGSYYCEVTETFHESTSTPPTYRAKIVTGGDSGGDADESTKTVVRVPLFDISKNGEVIQHHVGVIVTPGLATEPADGSGLEITGEGKVDLVYREEDDQFAVHEVLGNNDEAIAKVLATGDVTVISSLNEVIGDADIIGGTGIKVETTGRTIKISYDKDKEEEDEDPNADDDDVDDPCSHPGDEDPENQGGAGGGGSGTVLDGVDTEDDHGSGVPADDDTHTGDTNCEGC